MMYVPRAAREPVSPAVAGLAARAAERELVVCAGAGLSNAAPAGLPLGWALAEAVYDDLVARLGEAALDGADRHDLLSVANTVTALPGGGGLLQTSLRAAGNYTGAEPNYGHVALALLLLEGAVEVIVTNYDNCIERGGGAYGRVEVIVSDADRLAVRGPAVMKVHGCATRDGSLLASERQLAEPPIWVVHHLGDRLGAATVIFIGLGDVAAYVRIRIGQLLDQLGNADRVWVAATAISPVWTELVPDIGERFIEMSADEFLDALLRDYVRIAFQRLREVAEGHRAAGTYAPVGLDPAAGAAALVEALTAVVGALEIVAWARAAADGWPDGEMVMQSDRLREALVALALGASRRAPAFDGRRLRLDGQRVDLVLAKEAVASAVVAAAQARIERERADGRVGIRENVTILCHGHQGPLPRELPSRVVPGESPEDIIDGPNVPLLRLISAHRVLEGDLPEEWVA